MAANQSATLSTPLISQVEVLVVAQLLSGTTKRLVLLVRTLEAQSITQLTAMDSSR